MVWAGAGPVRGDGPTALERQFGPEVPAGALAAAAWGLSCASLAVLLALYVALTPGFFASLAGGGGAAWYLARQVLVNGLPVVFAINLAGFWLYARLARRPGAPRPLAALGLDLALRAGLFFGLHALSFAGAARFLGSFGGEPGQALAAVGPTLTAAAGFGNLAGVYLYATAPSAFPLFAAAVRARFAAPTLPALLAGFALWFGAVAAAISGIAALL